MAECSADPSVKDSGSVDLMVAPIPWKTISIASSPNSGAEIAYTPAKDAAKLESPQSAPLTISYQTSPAVELTASDSDGAEHPRWFDHWVLDSEAQPEGQSTITFDMNDADHTAVAVYDELVGDLNSDGSVDRLDANVLLQALLGDLSTTVRMDVNRDAEYDLLDARWILNNTFAGAGG